MVTEADCVAVLLPVAVAVCRSTEGEQSQGGQLEVQGSVAALVTADDAGRKQSFRQADTCESTHALFQFGSRGLKLTRVTDAVAVGVCVRVTLGVGSDGTSQQAFVYADVQT
jgi:hypothetical protein